MQTSFMHPPCGFALFYLRSVAPAGDYKDRITGKTIAKMTTGQIYWGAVPFVLIQILMVGLIIAFPNLVSGGLTKAKEYDTSKQRIEFQPMNEKIEMDASKLFGVTPSASAASAPASQPPSDDPLENAARGVKK
jgi:GntP family gluconate:H+ symporter